MTALLTDNLPLLAGAPNGIKKLRELILELAVRGKLVEQDASDEPASELLKRISAEKARLVAEGKIKKQKSLEDLSGAEKTFHLPSGWEWQRFADFALDVSTGPFGSLIHQSDYVTGGIPLVNPSHMIDGRIVPDHSVSLSVEMAESMASYRLNEGDMVMARRGEVGRVALVTEAEDGWLCGTGSFVLRFIPEVSKSYIWTLFRCNSVRTYLAGAAVGTTMVNLNHGILLKMPIAVPPLPEQHRIVAKVDELMALCDRLEIQQADADSAHAQLVQALLGSLTQASDAAEFAANWQRLAEHFHTLFSTEPSIDALKQTLLQLAVMGKLVSQDATDEPSNELLKHIQAEKLRVVKEGKYKPVKESDDIREDEQQFQLPDSWVWVRLADIAFQVTDGAHHTPTYIKTGVPFLSVKDMSAGYLDFSATRFISEEEHSQLAKRCCPQQGDLLLTKIGTTGVPVVITTNNVFSIFVSVALIKAPWALLDVNYLQMLIRSPFVKKQSEEGTEGVGNKNLVLRKISNFLLALPPLAEQHRIVAKVDQLMALCDQLKTQLSQARQLNQQLASTLVEQAVA